MSHTSSLCTYSMDIPASLPDDLQSLLECLSHSSSSSSSDVDSSLSIPHIPLQLTKVYGNSMVVLDSYHWDDVDTLICSSEEEEEEEEETSCLNKRKHDHSEEDCYSRKKCKL